MWTSLEDDIYDTCIALYTSQQSGLSLDQAALILSTWHWNYIHKVFICTMSDDRWLQCSQLHLSLCRVLVCFSILECHHHSDKSKDFLWRVLKSKFSNSGSLKSTLYGCWLLQAHLLRSVCIHGVPNVFNYDFSATFRVTTYLYPF